MADCNFRHWLRPAFGVKLFARDWHGHRILAVMTARLSRRELVAAIQLAKKGR
jgi:hypothetical protein